MMGKKGEADLYLVHIIDTEGPLYESLEATFERLENLLGIRLPATRENLLKIQSRSLDLKGKESAAHEICAAHNLDYNDSWPKLDKMLAEIMSPEFRQRYHDSRGRGWVFNWFAMDHVGFDENPRRRDVGYHNIFDHYKDKIHETASDLDELHYHFHPASTYRQGHVAGTSYVNSPHLFETLARRIVDRSWFPSCFRAGFYAERPDSHWFLEQWLPFDFSNNAKDESPTEAQQQDISGGRLGDWRRAPNDWSHYHPDHDDYQIPGNCRRSIFRALNVGTRLRTIEQADVEAAFSRSARGTPTILAFSDHDWRDMKRDIETVYSMVKKTAKRYPGVNWLHSRARQAAREVLRVPKSPLDFSVRLESKGSWARLYVEAKGKVFGPQPFLAVRTLDRRYLNDNFDFQIPGKLWTYTFDHQSIVPGSFDRVGVAANSVDGCTCVVVLDGGGEIVSKDQL
jgi:hypothetical protein